MPFSWRERVATQAGEVAGLSRGSTGRQGRDTWTPLGQCLFEITPYFRSGEVRLRRIVKSLLFSANRLQDHTVQAAREDNCSMRDGTVIVECLNFLLISATTYLLSIIPSSNLPHCVPPQCQTQPRGSSSAKGYTD